jgi:hypothetical protein
LVVAGYYGYNIYKNGPQELSFFWENYLALLTTALVFSTGLSAAVYYMSLDKSQMLAEGGNTGNAIYDVLFRVALLILVLYWKRIKS